MLAVMFRNELETLPDRGQHAQAEAIDLENAERVEIVLVPFNDGAAGHGGILDGNDFAERTLGDHHAADVLREMPWEPQEFPRQLDEQLRPLRIGIESRLAQP